MPKNSTTKNPTIKSCLIPQHLSGALIWMGAISVAVVEAYILAASDVKDQFNFPVASMHGGILVVFTMCWAGLNCLERTEARREVANESEPLLDSATQETKSAHPPESISESSPGALITPPAKPASHQFFCLKVAEKKRATGLAIFQLCTGLAQLICHFYQDNINSPLFKSTYALPISAGANIAIGMFALIGIHSRFESGEIHCSAGSLKTSPV